MNKIRNSFHLVIGFTALFAICNLSEVYQWQSRLTEAIALSLFVGALIGIGWEFFMGYLFNSPISILDIALTTIGAVIGGICSVYFHDVKRIETYSLCISGIILVIELIRILKIKFTNLNR